MVAQVKGYVWIRRGRLAAAGGDGEGGKGGGSGGFLFFRFARRAGGIWLLARSRHTTSYHYVVVTRFCGHTEFLRALGHEKGRVQNLNSNLEGMSY
jgi:hypothetical protein